MGTALLGTFLSLTYYFQGTLHYSALKSGFAFVPFSLGIITGATLASRLLPRFGPRCVMAGGLLLGMAGLFLFSTLDVHSAYISTVLPAEIIVSLGMGLSFVAMSSTALIGVSHQDAGVASALVNATQQTGGTMGAALINTIATSATVSYVAAHGKSAGSLTAGSIHGYTTAFTFSAIVLAVAAVSAFTLIRRGRPQRGGGRGWPRTRPLVLAVSPVNGLTEPTSSGRSVPRRRAGSGWSRWAVSRLMISMAYSGQLATASRAFSSSSGGTSSRITEACP